MPQAIAKLGSSGGEGDHGWVRRRGSKRSYRHDGIRLCDRESKALVLAIAPHSQNLSTALANDRQRPSHHPPKPMQVCGIARVSVFSLLWECCRNLGFCVSWVGDLQRRV